MAITHESASGAGLLVSIQEIRFELGGTLCPTSRSKVYKLIRDGELQLVKIDSRSFVTRASLEAYVDRLTEAAAAPQPA
jgi:hypothetical protein